MSNKYLFHRAVNHKVSINDLTNKPIKIVKSAGETVKNTAKIAGGTVGKAILDVNLRSVTSLIGKTYSNINEGCSKLKQRSKEYLARKAVEKILSETKDS
jgi:hypothetical protein